MSKTPKMITVEVAVPESITKIVLDLDRQLAESRAAHADLSTSILALAPECWDGDESADWLAVEFVKSMTGDRESTIPGHRCDGECLTS